MFSNDFRVSSLKYNNKVQRSFKMNKDSNQKNNTFANKEKEDEKISEKTNQNTKTNENGSFDFYV